MNFSCYACALLPKSSYAPIDLFPAETVETELVSISHMTRMQSIQSLQTQGRIEWDRNFLQNLVRNAKVTLHFVAMDSCL